MSDLYEKLLKAQGRPMPSWNGVKLFVMDPATRHVFANAGSNLPHDPASLTKLMTYYLVLEDMRDGKFSGSHVLTVSETAASRDYAHLKAGKKLTVNKCIQAMMIASDNSAATLLSEQLGKNPIARMNQTASHLGLTNTQFVNADGLPAQSGPKNSTTARDICVLMTQLYHAFPDEMKRTMNKPHVDVDVELYNAKGKLSYEVGYSDNFLNRPKHPLRMPEGLNALAKAGYTDRARHNLGSIINLDHGGHALVIVAMGAHWKPKKLATEVGLVPAVLTDKKYGAIKGNYMLNALVKHVAQGISRDSDFWYGPEASDRFIPAGPAHPLLQKDMMAKAMEEFQKHNTPDALRVVRELPLQDLQSVHNFPKIPVKPEQSKKIR